MEASGIVHQLAHETIGNDIAAMVRREGPFASLYLDTNPEVENAGPQIRLRWRHAREALETAGAPPELLEAIEGHVENAHHRGATLAVIADAASGELLVDHHPEPPTHDVARFGPLPNVASLIGWRQVAVPHVVVRTDRTGADLVLFRRWDDEIAREVEGSSAADATKVSPGGWSQRRIQQRVENTWESNAGKVADELVAAVDGLKARLVVVTGDVRARQLLRESLPDRITELIEEVDGGRSPDGSVDDIADDVVRLVASAAATETVALLQKFKEEIGQHDRAVDGIEPTLEALSASQVETLLVHDDPDDDRTAWCAPDPVPVAVAAPLLRDLGVDEPREARLVDVAVRAAIGTGAGVWLVPAAGGPADSLGALLRWA